MTQSLAGRFREAVAAHGARTSLVCGGERLTYDALMNRASAVAAVLTATGRPRLVAVFAGRSVEGYVGVLGTLLAGAGYVPLNAKFPDERNAKMLEVSGATSIVVDEECEHRLDALLSRSVRAIDVLLPKTADVDRWRARFPRHRFPLVTAEGHRASVVSETRAEEIAYLLFTSGSTGEPKGVMVSNANVLSFVDTITAQLGFTPDDRFSQTFDLTFDLSAFDLFVCWLSGACLCIPTTKQLLMPVEYIVKNELTVWFSVPATAMLLRQLKRLSPGVFPSLRLSLFCGERLPAVAAEAWRVAAPRAPVHNLYGPTEATIACTGYSWRGVPDEAVDGVVPIGKVFDTLRAAIVDDTLRRVQAGTKGELCVKGPQVAMGYWQDQQKTSERFVAMEWDDESDNRWYRTGDLAYVDARGELIHCGRNDQQIKLRGYRIELAEIEHVIRSVTDSDFVVVVPFPTNEHGPIALTAVVQAGHVSEDALLDRARALLPDYMVPGEVVFVEQMPLNPNGKIDRNAALRILEAREAS